MYHRTNLFLIPLLVIAFATIIFLSLDMNGHRQRVYTASLSLQPASGMLRVIFYDHRYSTYRRDASIKLTEDDWCITEDGDATYLTALTDRATIVFSSYAAPLYATLLRFPGVGTAILTDGLGRRREIDLQADSVSLYSFEIGGNNSAVPSVPGRDFVRPLQYVRAYGLVTAILALMALVASYKSRLLSGPRLPRGDRVTAAAELFGYAAPLVVTPLFVQLAYWPASVPYDGGLQWMEAALPGHLSAAIVIPATLLFRIFHKLFGSPAFVIFGQIALAALGVSLILREMRKRGVPRLVTQLGAVGIAALPQYPTFITILSKDAWNCIGVLMTTYAALALLRQVHDETRARPLLSPLLVIVMVAAAVFAGTMRPNTLPAILAFMAVMAVYFGKKRGARFPAAVFIVYVMAALITPSAAVYFSTEGETARAAQLAQGRPATGGQAVGDDGGLPLGVFANMYIIHLFAAAVHSGVDIAPEDAAVFFKVAPQAAWQEYDCSYGDKTQIAIRTHGLMDDAATGAYFSSHQVEMALIVLRLIPRHPGILLERQVCVTRMLWYIGYRDYPFQVDATVGYDSVPENFLATVGGNRSLIGKGARLWIQKYFSWSETWTHLWLFWKPFLYTALGLFSVLLYSMMQRKHDVLLVAALPLLMTISLAVVIPFPAYRYQYPATLLFMLFILFAFARPAPGETAVSK